MALSVWRAIAAGGAVIGVVGIVALSRRKQTDYRRVALIGDSYAVGLGPELQNIFQEFRYEGHIGTNTAQWASHAGTCGQCGDWLTEYKPDVVLVSLGINDSAPRQENYQAIVRALHGSGARVIWIKPPIGAHASSYSAVRKAIDALGVATVPAPAVPMASDGIHPTSYSEWAKDVAHAVDPSLPMAVYIHG